MAETDCERKQRITQAAMDHMKEQQARMKGIMQKLKDNLAKRIADKKASAAAREKMKERAAYLQAIHAQKRMLSGCNKRVRDVKTAHQQAIRDADARTQFEVNAAEEKKVVNHEDALEQIIVNPAGVTIQGFTTIEESLHETVLPPPNLSNGARLGGRTDEGFAVAFTTPKYDTENAVMRSFYNSVTSVKDSDDPDPNKWTGNDDYEEITKNDYDEFSKDVETVFTEQYNDISKNIVSLKSHQSHLGSIEPLDQWIRGNQINIDSGLETIALDTATNERRTEYENQVVEANKTWKLIVTAIFVLAICVFLFYETRELIAAFSRGKIWSII